MGKCERGKVKSEKKGSRGQGVKGSRGRKTIIYCSMLKVKL
jgi:hypothetical protein